MRKRKWLGILLAVTLLLAMVPAAAAAAPVSYPLYAGQGLLVGEVLVWNDGDTIYVKYVVNEPDWYLTETHLHVANSITGFPTAGGKTKNLAPGQFTYSEHHDYVKDYLYEVPIGSLTGTVAIAAHAVVKTKDQIVVNSGTVTPTLTWSRSSEQAVVAVSGYGASWDPGDALLIPTPLVTEDEVWDGGTTNQYFTGYSTRNDIKWASWPHANPGNTDLRRFKAEFTLSADVAANITSAALRMPDFYPNAIPINDNVYIFLNGDLQFWGGTRVQGAAGSLTTFQGMPGVPAIPTYTLQDWGGLDLTGWYLPGTFPNLSLAEFTQGPNFLDVFAEENETGGGMAKLELVLGYSYQVTIPGDCETAWAGGTRYNTQGNWATYLLYELRGEQYSLLETVFVSATSNTGVTTSNILASGQVYKLVAKGTFTYNPQGDWADAEWYLKNGVIVKGDTEGSVPYVLDVKLTGGDVNPNWGDYNPAHVYEMEITGSGSTAHFFIHDSNHTDNVGGITVEIYLRNY